MRKDYSLELKQALRDEVEKHNISLMSIAKDCSCSISSVKNVLDDTRWNTREIVERVCECLGIKIDKYIDKSVKRVNFVEERDKKKYKRIKKISGANWYLTLRHNQVFKKFVDNYRDYTRVFSGTLLKIHSKISNEHLFLVVDGGRIYKDRHLERDGLKFKGWIKHYTWEEVDKMIEDDNEKKESR